MKQPKGWLKLILGIVLAVVVVFVQALFLIAWITFSGFSQDGIESLTFGELVGGVLALLAVIALGGKKYLRSSSGAYKFAWQATRVFLIADLAIMVIGVVGQVAIGEGKPLVDNWLYNVILLVIICLGIGMFEEGICRGLLLQGLLARMGTTKKGMVAALILSSLIFGAAHVFGTDVGNQDITYWLQAILKTLQTGIIGFILGVVVIKTRSLWPAIIIHGANDFILMVVNIGLWGESMSFDYVMTGDESVQLIGVYLFMCAVYIPSLLYCIRELKKMPGGSRGAFYNYKPQPEQQPHVEFEQTPQAMFSDNAPFEGAPVPPQDYEQTKKPAE